MAFTRRTFIKTVGASGIVLASHDLIGDLLAQSPQGQPLQSKFKGLSDIVRARPVAAAPGVTPADSPAEAEEAVVAAAAVAAVAAAEQDSVAAVAAVRA